MCERERKCVRERMGKRERKVESKRKRTKEAESNLRRQSEREKRDLILFSSERGGERDSDREDVAALRSLFLKEKLKWFGKRRGEVHTEKDTHMKLYSRGSV